VRVISVLLVDDSLTFLRIVARFLQEHNDMRVVGSSQSGQEALVLARDLQPQVILLDLAMPELHGLDAIPLLRAAVPEAGILVLTLLEGQGYRSAALARGADDLVAKASMGTDLLLAIRRVAKSGRRQLNSSKRDACLAVSA